MNAECKKYREQIAKGLFEDLEPAQTEAVEAHLRHCSDCAEQRILLLSTLSELRSLEEAPPPRHFYVYEDRGRSAFWNLFRQTSLLWRAVAGATLAVLLLLGGAAASNLQMRVDEGVVTLGFGKLSTQPEINPEQLKAEVLRAAQNQLLESRGEWMAQVRQEISQSEIALTQKQQDRLKLALDRMEGRFNDRIADEGAILEAKLNDSAVHIYRTLSRERQEQLALLNDRIDLLSVKGRIQGSQTEALMATVLQMADLRTGAR